MNPEGLEAEWLARCEETELDAAMRFTDNGLVLGMGTVLLPVHTSPWDFFTDVADPRFRALLAAAHLRSAKAAELAHLRKAAERWREGGDGLASIHLALSGLNRLSRPVPDARRLFLTDRLLKEGLSATAIVRALNVEPGRALEKYSPDQPRVPAGSGRTSGQWIGGDTPVPASPAGSQPEHGQSEETGHDPRAFNVHLPSFTGCASAESPLTPFGHALKEVADTVEIADSISKWRQLGPAGEAAILEAVTARGWEVIGAQVYVRTTLGLRVEDLMVYVPPGTDGNATGFDAFVEVKVNGGRYSPLQRAKDAIIGTSGGTLLTPIRGYSVGQRIVRETGLANVTIVYESE